MRKVCTTVVLILVAQTAFGQGVMMDIQTEQPGKLITKPEPPAKQNQLPPARPVPAPAQPAQKEEQPEKFVQCGGQELPTSNPSIADRMFEKILGYQNAFGSSLVSTKDPEDKFQLVGGRTLKAKVQGYVVNAKVCQAGSQIRVFLDYNGYEFHFTVSKVGAHSVHLRQTRSDYGDPIKPAEFVRANR